MEAERDRLREGVLHLIEKGASRAKVCVVSLSLTRVGSRSL